VKDYNCKHTADRRTNGHGQRDKKCYQMIPAKIPATFGAWVRTRRKQLDLTQSGLGKRAGCSAAAIRKIEADERKPSRQLAELLAVALEIPPAEKESFLQLARGMFVEEIRFEKSPHPHNIPTLLTSTVDRTHDLASVCTLFKDKTVHLVTIIGPPGIGKTRLSIHCANELLDDFPDGVWFVDLADITNAEFFIPALARLLPSLGLLPSPGLEQLISGLKEKRILLLLDNFEQIAQAGSLDVAQMLKSCAHLKILVTSRVPLHIYGEHEYVLPPLSIPPRDVKGTEETLMHYESVQLFVTRVRQHRLSFSLTPENAADVIDIVTILDGIPLALELAAATIRQMSLNEMVVLLRGTDWVRKLATPARDLPQRQRTLENVLDWSYNLLNEEHRTFFCKLGVFSGRFDSAAATAVCESESPGLLNALTDHSLLEREIFNGKTYWHMLEFIHEYASSKLDEPARSRVEHLRADYFSAQLRNLRQAEVSRSVREEYYRLHIQDLLAALRWAIKEKQTETGFQLAEFLDDMWALIGYWKEGLDLMRQLMTLPDRSGPQVRANRLQMASDLAWQLHDFTSALDYSRSAVELGRVHGLIGTHPWYLNRLGRIYIEQERYAEAKAVLEECLGLASASPQILNPGSPLAQLGEVAFFEGRLDDAKHLLERALDTLGTGDAIFLAMAGTDLAEVALASRDYSAARRWLEQAFEPASQHVRRLLVFLCALAGYFVLSGTKKTDLQTAAQLYGATETLSMRSGINLTSFYQDLNSRRMRLARNKLSAEEWQRAYETGRGWDRGEAIQLVKGML